jgi:CheY-like chemotaxis protein
MCHYPGDRQQEDTMSSIRCRSSKCEVLIADDNEEFLAPLQLLLEANGCAVQRARSGNEVLKMAETHTFDALILDIRFPDLSGYTVVRQLRMRPAYVRAPIIGLTGWDSPGGVAFAVAEGFDYFFLKPVDFDRIEHILNQRVGAAK